MGCSAIIAQKVTHTLHRLPIEGRVIIVEQTVYTRSERSEFEDTLMGLTWRCGPSSHPAAKAPSIQQELNWIATGKKRIGKRERERKRRCNAEGYIST